MITEKQALFLQNTFGMTACKIENGRAFHLGTETEIPVEHIAYNKIEEDGFYYLSEATCGNAVHNNIEPTKENKLKYGCQVGKHLEGCTGYAGYKCAVYFLEDLGKHSVSLNAETLINVLNIE